jgi:hypothetical protein
MSWLVLLFFLFPSLLWGATCKRLADCLHLATEITGEKFIYDKKILSETFELNSPLELNRDNVKEGISEALNVFGLAKLPSKLPRTIRIIPARDIRFHSDVPTFEASKNSLPNIPESHDPVSVSYKGEKGVDMEVIAENIRPLLSRYGRAMPMRDGTLVVTDLATHVRKIMPHIEGQDFPPTKEEIQQKKLREEREHELDLARAKSQERHDIFPKGEKSHDH